MKSRRSLKPQTSTRLRQKMKWQHVAAGIALAAILVAVGVFLYLNLGNSHKSKAAPARTVIHTNGSGNWADATTWDLGRTPQDGDSIVLKSGHSILLESTVAYKAVNIAIYGDLWIDHAAQLKLDDVSTIEVFSPGTIDGGKQDGTASNAASSKIVIGNKTVWDSSMPPVSGYSYMDKNGYQPIGTLPVQLAYFKASVETGKVVAAWATYAEENNDFFTVERSADGKTFRKVGEIKGVGNSQETQDYSFVDENPLAGLSFYRLKQTDFDGKFEYFNPVAVKVAKTLGSGAGTINIKAYGPNPFIDDFFVNFDLSSDGPVEVKLQSLQGNLVVSETIDGFLGSNRYSFTDRNGLPPGIYVFSLVQQNNPSKGIRLIKK